ncbi:MAG: hypothetical protein RBS14_02180 [Atribacterota bacterium]|nr:hypothetical protein [Atribacterota bacterium]
MGTLEAFADLFTDEPASFGSATPANVANPAKPRIVPSVPEVANACESCESQTAQSEKQTRFAAIRSHSQTSKPATECARSQDSQHSHGTIRKTFAEAAKGVGAADSPPAPTAEGMRSYRTPQPAPSAPKPITRPVLRFKLREGGGTVLGQPDDTPASLLADLIERWPDELVAAWSGTDQVYPLES